ncbi:phage holin family protein [Miniphocaeibacter massiliensis]|uniref:phage holin family protein n=1 Tax=Miniphocaeibacter massiliensis TaxID=2041841 RepID=UPI000C1B88B6|nr:phage holin family protein [Miniphocaeibacter massiliensis]
MLNNNFINIIFSTIGGFLGWYLGGIDGFIYVLIIFIAVDYITGILRAIVEKRLSSRVGAKGIIKKIIIFIVVGVANLLDLYLLKEGNAVLRTAVIFFYLSNEGISLLENASTVGLPIPEKLKEILIQLHNKEDSSES